ncbi:MAG: UvrD-helicase domain-containing protein, partial [Clostridia bacterium]|nr:UvrD-helicase domain-containing protein [Clostridia bacterium]
MGEKDTLTRILDDVTSKNILVSASAGTGKTYTMVQKVISNLLNDSTCDMDNLLMLTFSRESASDMRNKIEIEIRKVLSNDKEARFKDLTKDQKLKLRTQLNKIPNSQISTIDSFCYTLIKKYFNLINIDPSIRIGDPAELEILLLDVFNELFTKYIKEDEEFVDLISEYRSYDNYDSFYKMIKDLLNFAKVQKIPFSSIDTFNYIDFKKFNSVSDDDKNFFNMCESVDTQEYKEKISESYLTLTKNKLNSILNDLEKMVREYNNLYDVNFEKEINKVQKAINIINNATNINQIDEFFKYVNLIEIENLLTAKSNQKLIKEYFTTDEYNNFKSPYSDDYTNIISEIKDDYLVYKKTYAQNNLNKMSKKIKMIVSFAKELDKEFHDRKLQKGIIGYDDCNMYALMALSNDIVQKDNPFRYIFIDEYQDTNYLQEYLIELISPKCKQLFCVGDIKQSIYGFRNAEPKIFLDRMNNIKNNFIKNGTIYELDKNYRSDKEIVTFINELFSNIINEETCDIKFTKSSSDKTFDSVIDKIKICEIIKPEEIKEDTRMSIYDIENENIKIKVNNDISIMANKINYLIKEKGVAPHNIAVLFRTNDQIFEFSKLLKQLNLSYCISRGNKNNFEELNTLISALRISINSDDDIPLYDVMSSIIGRFSEQEIADIRRTTKEGIKDRISLWDSLIKYSDCIDSEQYSKAIDEKINAFKTFLDDIKNKSRYIPVSTLLTYILSNSKMDAYLLSNDYYEGVDKLSEINQFIDYVNSLSVDEDVTEFLNFYDNIYEGLTRGNSNESITLLTYHSSKGLEFDYVFMPELDASNGNKSKKYEKDYNFGIGISDYNGGMKSEDEEYASKDTFPKIVIKRLNDIKETKEGIRVFYVATTRAKKALWMSYQLTKKTPLDWKLRDKKDNFYRIINKNPNSYILYSLSNAGIGVSKIDKYMEVIDDIFEIKDRKETKTRKSSYTKLFDDKDIFERKYAYEEATKTQGKYTVTEILIDSNNDVENSSMVN